MWSLLHMLLASRLYRGSMYLACCSSHSTSQQIIYTKIFINQTSFEAKLIPLALFFSKSNSRVNATVKEANVGSPQKQHQF